MNIIYNDTVSLNEDVVQIAIRNGSIDINAYTNASYGFRINIDGCWSIVSTNKNNPELLNKFKQTSLNIMMSKECEGLAEAELYKGYVEIGKELPEAEDVARLIHNLCEEIRGLNVIRCEIIVILKNVIKAIERDYNDRVQELRRFVEIEIGLLGKSSLGLPIFSSTYNALISWNSKEVLKSIENSFKLAVDRLTKSYGMKSLKPYLYGKATVVLDHKATAALFHEISHMLDSTYLYSQKLLGYKLGPDELEVYDEPYSYSTPSMRFFDDEGVITKKRTLIENGVVRDLHHTRSTARTMGSEPGSAYGLFHKPVPFHTVLTIKPGDWRFNEILEDTKRGFYVEGVAMATLEEGYIKFIPEFSYTIENGEFREPVKIIEVKIPLQSIKTINAISKDTKVRASIEKSWIVSEVAPIISLVAYIQ
ncbi:MAG: metallopeptidase TldD-related protein [Ignisphaera sp.]|uniref:Metalloprotease TldD/E C-terminal domain-containing protein n=1 Tax=Ignisphaera aggregans TaxID=334771 RepID=A0A7J3MZJ2_9CREN